MLIYVKTEMDPEEYIKKHNMNRSEVFIEGEDFAAVKVEYKDANDFTREDLSLEQQKALINSVVHDSEALWDKMEELVQNEYELNREDLAELDIRKKQSGSIKVSTGMRR